MYHRFSTTNFEQIIFSLFNGVGYTGAGVVKPTIKYIIPFSIILVLLLYFLFYDFSFKKVKISLKKIKIYPASFVNEHKILITILLFLFSVVFLLNSVNFFDYFFYSRVDSKFIEENYVDPKTTKINFEEKRNLIMIFVESLETSLFTKEQGGYWDYDVIPELYEILDDEDSVIFYNNNKSEELNVISGSSWTTASIVANETAVPFKISINGNNYQAKKFMNGSYALGDILKDNGYHNEVLSGATTAFGGLAEFYTRHGEYNIIDEQFLDKYGFNPKQEDLGAWGLNDNYLFNIAKERLNNLSQKEEPFNMNIITIDTHFVDGYVGNYSITKFNEQYENAYATTSKLIYDFIIWLKEQPYYDNTTILVMGDHISMQNDFFDKRGAKDRYVYYCIINPRTKEGNFKNRIYTALDTYPTILYSIGANINGNKLGLGVNLFSDEKTLAEKYGVKELDSKLLERSSFYNDILMDDDYLYFK